MAHAVPTPHKKDILSLETWKKNLYAVVVAEFVVMVGFSFVNPFLPLYIQELGSFSDRDAAFWAGIATGVTGASMFFTAPLWGLVADRSGRKPMVLRSQFGTAVTMALQAFAPNISYLIALRFMQGMLSGTVAAASALVASQTPPGKMPFAMGLLMLAIYAGITVGPVLGGVVADTLGFRAAFLITSGLMLVGGLVVLFFTTEKFEKAAASAHRASVTDVWRLVTAKEIFPLLLGLCALQAGTQILSPVIPLFVQELEPEGQAATASGIAFGLMGVLAAVSAMVADRLGTRVSLKNILVFSCLGTAVLNLPPIWAGTLTQLVIFVVLTGLLKGGFMTAGSALIGLSVAGAEQGIAFGIATSAQALGSGIGPLLGGSLAALFGFKSIFVVTAALFLVVGVLAARFLTERQLPAPGRPPSRETS